MKHRSLLAGVLAALVLTLGGCGAVNAADGAALTAREAEETALEHAGLTARDVRWLRTEYEADGAGPKYEVRFRHNGLEYEYEISARTGQIISFDRDD